MQPWIKIFIVAVVAFAFMRTALASTPSPTTITSIKATYLAPLVDGCYPGDSKCDKIEGKYLVSLREGYQPSSHLSYIAENIHVDPVQEWKLRWIGDENYTVDNVSAESLDLIRQDPGVVEVEEESWIVMDEVDRCRDPDFSEEEKRICYAEKDLPLCKRPSLSTEERRECYRWLMGQSCGDPELSEDEKRDCHEASLLDPCQNPELSKDEQRFCRDGGSVEQLEVSVHGGSKEL